MTVIRKTGHVSTLINFITKSGNDGSAIVLVVNGRSENNFQTVVSNFLGVICRGERFQRTNFGKTNMGSVNMGSVLLNLGGGIRSYF